MDKSNDLRLTSERTRKFDQAQTNDALPKLGSGLIFVAFYAGVFFLLTSGADSATRKLVSGLMSPLAALIAVVWSLWGIWPGARDGKPRKRRDTGPLSATFLMLGVASFGVGAALWSYCDNVLHRSPFPSSADIGYLGYYAMTIVGILLLPSRPLPTYVRVRVLLDGLMVMAALVTFSWFLVLGPNVMGGQGSFTGKFLGITYPVLDLAMMFCILVLLGRSQDRTIVQIRNLLCGGVIVYVIADVGFAYLTLHGQFEGGNPFDAGWMIANLLTGQACLALRNRKVISSAMTSRKGRALDGTRPASFWRMILPYALVPMMAGLLFYVWHQHIGGPIAMGVEIGSGVLLFLVLARQVFAIAENARLYRYLQDAYWELEAMATTDGMTGLSNHRAFQEAFRAELERSKLEGTSTALLMVDVDRFKAYNDSFGHPAGDEALRIVARILKETVRAVDFPARYGGEEFAVILSETELDEAIVTAERIRAACELQTFPGRPVTLSIGVVADHSAEAGKMIEIADQALYLAKRAGRNRVVTGDMAAPPQMPAPEVNPLSDAA